MSKKKTEYPLFKSSLTSSAYLYAEKKNRETTEIMIQRQIRVLRWDDATRRLNPSSLNACIYLYYHAELFLFGSPQYIRYSPDFPTLNPHSYVSTKNLEETQGVETILHCTQVKAKHVAVKSKMRTIKAAWIKYLEQQKNSTMSFNRMVAYGQMHSLPAYEVTLHMQALRVCTAHAVSSKYSLTLSNSYYLGKIHQIIQSCNKQ